MDNLVIPQHTKNLIKGLATKYNQGNIPDNGGSRPWSADVVTGKGSGLIFLLHGKPGVGKTFTAECVAEMTQRPLMLLTSGDVGVEPEEVEKSLTSYFKKAKRWGAVVLLDEADIYLQQRSTDDLERNMLVAVFMRAMEYYPGILFLTTNRVGAFDDAFISRVHIVLHYKALGDEERKKIWENLFAKLKKDRGDQVRVDITAKDFVRRGQELKDLEWNGREICNGFQTAVALAEYNEERDEQGIILLKDEHLRQVVEMSSNFKKYLKDLHVGDEDRRAQQRLERLVEKAGNT
ncbi:MAG: hypothetical protein M1823_004690 [Watsoniomyces obsoletus]|nr:MAG: hypothetical protein M1823_004690 [Watsoniomyces obsoletus]